MARIITINPVKHNGAFVHREGILEWIPDDCTHSINLETVLSLTCTPRPNRMRVKHETHGLWKIIFGDRYKIVESGTYFYLSFKYKNYRQPSDSFPISQEEYERLKPELAKYGWHI